MTQTEGNLPPNVYRVAQRRFDAISGSPWVYWLPDGLRHLFEKLPGFANSTKICIGMRTSDNSRFLRYWWEIGLPRMAKGCRSRKTAQSSGKPWVPYMKGGQYRKWYGNQEYVVKWYNDGEEIKAHTRHLYPQLGDNLGWKISNEDYYFREGVTYSYLTSATFSARLSPGGFVFDVAGSSLFPDDLSLVLSVMNSTFAAYALKLINPTVNFQVGDLARLPVPTVSGDSLRNRTRQAVMLAKATDTQDETTFDFIAPPRWDTGLADLAVAQARLAALEAQIDDEVYALYGISAADRAAIEAELNGLTIDDLRFTNDNDEDSAEIVNPKSEIENRQELAVRWISYAMGVVLGRFQPGIPGALGSAVYRRADFAVGSLPEPDEDDFNELVGSP